MIASLAARLPLPRHTSFWVYLALITVAEAVTSLVNLTLGVTLHVGLLLVLLVHAAFGQETSQRSLALALVLAPLTRLLSLGLPLRQLPQLLWYPLISVPLLIAVVLIARVSELSTADLRLRLGNLPLQCALGGYGFVLGVAEFAILKPKPIVAPITWNSFWLAALVLIMFTGCLEELIFRGLLQTVARPVLRRSGLVFVALLFAVLHIGHLSALDVVFVFGVGLLFGYVVERSGSILGVTLAHGLTNVMLFVVLPSQWHEQSGPLAAALDWAIGIGTLFAFAATLALVIAHFRERSVQHRIASKESG